MGIEEQLEQVAREVRELRSAQRTEKESIGPRLLTTAEAAEVLRLTPKTIRAQIRAGRLTALRFGRSWRIREADLEVFLQTGSKRGPQVIAEAAERLLED